MSTESIPSPIPQQELTDKLIAEMKGMFNPPPGYRPAHAKGLMLSGVFHPTSEARGLSSAPIFSDDTKYHNITVRLSSATGYHTLPDYNKAGHPRGIAMRIHYDADQHTDILVHSTPHFPVQTGEDFFLFLKAAQDPTGALMRALAATRPGLQAFLGAPKTMPSSFARDSYWSVTAFEYINAEGVQSFIRYRLIPTEGLDHLDDAALLEKEKAGKVDYLYDEIKERLAGDGSATYNLVAQIAGKGDDPSNSAVHWSESNRTVDLGKIRFESVFPEEKQAHLNKHIIFDPTPKIEGIKPSADPLLPVRTSVYYTSGLERRAAKSGTAAVQKCPFTGVEVPEGDLVSHCH
jgi:catalase